MSSQSGARVTAFGKIPSHAEYIGALDGGEPSTSFAAWLEEGIGHAVDRGGAPWRDAFQASSPQAFLYRAPAKARARSALLGVIAPSEDSFARPFPFVVMTELRESSFGGHASALPVAAERFFSDAASLCHSARVARSTFELLTRASALEPPSSGRCSAASQDLADWATRGGHVGKLWSRLFPSGGAEAAARCLRVLVDTVVPVRTHGGLGTCRAVRLPLGNGGPAAASFWLEVVRALAQWNRTIPTAFWPAERASGSVLIQLGEVPATTFAQLWLHPLQDVTVIDLAVPDIPIPSEVAGLTGPVARVVADPAASIASLLAALATPR